MSLRSFVGFYSARIKKALPLIKYYLGQLFFLIKDGKFKSACNYFWTISFSKEDGAALLKPLELLSPKFVPYPNRIEVEATTKCNFKCLKCESAYWDIKPRDMSLSEFEKVLAQFPKLKAISLSGIGHNWLNKDYMEMLRLLKSKSIFTQFFDTFYSIDEEKARTLIDLRVDKVWMSIDGATKETYEKLQVGSNFDRVTENVKRMFTLKKEMKSRFPEICFHFIVTEYNSRETPLFIDLVHSINPDPKILNLLQFTKLIPFKENEYLRPNVDQAVIDETLAKAKEYGNFRIDSYRMGEQERSSICECLEWEVPFITSDGVIYPCCAFTEGNMREIMHKYAFGNIFETSFEEIWNSREFREFANKMHRGEVPARCKIRDCPSYTVK